MHEDSSVTRVEVVYTPDSQLRSPRRLLRSMWRDLVASRELSLRLARRDISAQYRQSLFGVVWAFLPPLASGLLFVFLNRQGVLHVGDTGIPYVPFALIGTTLWAVMSGAIGAPLRLVAGSKSMLIKLNFPREALILAGVGELLFDVAIKLTIVVAVFVLYRLPVSWGTALAPVGVLVLILFGTLIGMALTPVAALYGDVAMALPVVTSLWMLLTPVVYPAPPGWGRSLLAGLNPASPLIIGARDLLTAGTLTDPVPFALVSGLTVFGILVMWVVYRAALPIVIERMGS